MPARSVRSWLGLLVLLSACGIPVLGEPPTNPEESPERLDAFYWTMLTPEKDSRDADEQEFDDLDSKSWIEGMNETEVIFRHRLVWNKVAIKDLLALHTPFCELAFDAVKPLVLTDKEKAILREYLARGGFVYLQEDTYPYGDDLTWNIKQWAVVDFFMKDLPAASPDFTVRQLDEDDPMNNFIYKTTVDIQSDGATSPNSASNTLLSFRKHPCVFVTTRDGYLEGDKTVAVPKPYPHEFSIDAANYKLIIDRYVYATMH